ncbi:MAG TPA: hypothetical protein P5144_09895 [Thermoanaerobaculia bacterium]|nr:hypothetical protein [Thermoanaerobaculia bacterium]HRS36723.1 hypothetical protein [Thermoanaerobaculia bacterium]HRU09674.1 hypothetical protein [Thermoanaerobaculia bacterium]
MLLVCSSGRCATLALCEAINRFTSAQMEHEPAPRLLRESWLCHLGLDYWTPLLSGRIAFFRERLGERYGQTLRAAPLLPDLAHALSSARFVLLFREPDAYVRSASSRGVLARGDEWDLYRLMPLDVDLSEHSRAERIGLHWLSVNTHLVSFAKAFPERSLAIVVAHLEDDLASIVSFADWRVDDYPSLSRHLVSRPNAGGVPGFPVEDPASIRHEIRDRLTILWSEICSIAANQQPTGIS